MDYNTYLAHVGVIGMRWGVRREGRQLNRMAKKDAKKFAKAKMAYGEGAGIQRRHVKAEITSKSRNPKYKEAFDKQLEVTNMTAATRKAKAWRKGEDAKSQTKRSVKAVARFMTGTSSLAAAGILYATHKPAVDAAVSKAFKYVKVKVGGL